MTLLLGIGVQVCSAEDSEKPWVSVSRNGLLSYRTTAAGDRIMDFSYAGYRGGGVALPSPPAVVTVSPGRNRDDAVTIQKAIDEVSARPLVDGFRGAVLLAPGTFRCESTITLRSSGVVLRGSGQGSNGTVLQLQGTPHVAITIDGPSKMAEPIEGAVPVRVMDPYVPSGSLTLSVADAKGFAVHDTVQIVKKVTPEWVKSMGMDTLVRSGKPQTWVRGDIEIERTIARIDGSRLTLDVPLPDALDSKFQGQDGATVVKLQKSDRLSEIGIESMRIVSGPQKVALFDPVFQAVVMDGVTDAWVRDVRAEETISTIEVRRNTRRVTIEQVEINHTTTVTGAAKPLDISCDGSQILINRCTGTGDKLVFIATGSKVFGPNVALNCTFHGDGQIQPHARWAMGLLVDNCQVPEGAIDFMNRGIMGSGHGWTIGFAVAWNCTAKSFLIQQPPGATNWAIGCIGAQVKSPMPVDKGGTPSSERGQPLPQGDIESPGKPVNPASLYLTQLRERLGAAAVTNIGY
jgi:hypothetical protein